MSLSSISELVLRNLQTEKKVYDEFILELLSEVDDNIRKCSRQEIPRSFYRLAEYVMNEVQANDFSENSSGMVLLYGKLWAIINLVDIAEQKENLDTSIDEDVKRFARSGSFEYIVFEKIHKNSGIEYNALGDSLKGHSFELSKVLNDVNNAKYFASRKFGSKKYYYLTENGKELIKKIKKERLPSKPLDIQWIESQYSQEKQMFSFGLYENVMPRQFEHLGASEGSQYTVRFYQNHKQMTLFPSSADVASIRVRKQRCHTDNTDVSLIGTNSFRSRAVGVNVFENANYRSTRNEDFEVSKAKKIRTVIIQ